MTPAMIGIYILWEKLAANYNQYLSSYEYSCLCFVLPNMCLSYLSFYVCGKQLPRTL